MTDRQWSIIKMFMTIIGVYMIIRIVTMNADKKTPNMFGNFERMLQNFQNAINKDMTSDADKVTIM